jgi:hypothetical protein
LRISQTKNPKSALENCPTSRRKKRSGELRIHFEIDRDLRYWIIAL